MIDFYTWATPNGIKVAAMLEECGLAYNMHPVRLGKGEQKEHGLLQLNGNGKIPVLRDDDGPGGSPLVLAESAAIMLYLSEKTGGALVPGTAHARHEMMQWVMFQMSAVGPIFGQLHHFKASAPEPVPYALDRFERESRRLLGVLDAHLANRPWLAGDAYSIADACTWPWIRSWQMTIKNDLDGFAEVARWYDACTARPASRKAIAVYDELRASALLPDVASVFRKKESSAIASSA